MELDLVQQFLLHLAMHLRRSWPLCFFLVHVCVCAHAHMYAYLHSGECVHVHVATRGQCWVCSSIALHLIFLKIEFLTGPVVHRLTRRADQ